MASGDSNLWANTQAALVTFMENFNCSKCKTPALDPIRYQKCGHLFCAGCIGSKSQCGTCQTSAKRNEVHSDVIVPKLITYGNAISQIIKQTNSPIKNDDGVQGSNLSVQDHDISLKTQNIPKGIDKRNVKGETRLHRACLKPDIKTVRSLLKDGANPNTRDYSDWPPLHEAISFGYYEVCEVLLEAGAMPDIPGNHNRTALHEAVLLKDLREIKLLRQYNADVNARDSYGKTPLDYAETEEVRKLLLDDNPTENVLERTLANTSNLTHLSNNNFMGNGTQVLGLNLSSESLLMLNKVANKHKIKIIKTFTSAVTHVVVEVNDQDVTTINYEILLAILHGKWILTSQWIRYCISLANLSTVELEPFEVQGTTSAPRSNTPMRARENAQKQNPRLFNNCHFFFAMNNQATYSLGKLEFTKSSLSKLVTEGGGKVLNREPNPELIQTCKEIPFHVGRDLTHPLHRCSHYIIYVHGQDEPGITYNMSHIKSLPLIWLIESIEQFELLDPRYFGIIE